MENLMACLLNKVSSLKKRNGFFIECGANDGIWQANCKYFEDSFGWTGVNIEANPYCIELLNRNRPNCINISCALGDEDGKKVILNMPHHSKAERRPYNIAGGSMAIFTDKFQQILDKVHGANIKQCEVNVKTYKTIIEECNVQHVDLFVLDVEGAEEQVLIGMQGCKVLPDVMVVEHNAGRTKEDVLQFLCPYGYQYIATSESDSFFVKT